MILSQVPTEWTLTECLWVLIFWRSIIHLDTSVFCLTVLYAWHDLVSIIVWPTSRDHPLRCQPCPLDYHLLWIDKMRDWKHGWMATSMFWNTVAQAAECTGLEWRVVLQADLVPVLAVVDVLYVTIKQSVFLGWQANSNGALPAHDVNTST